VRTLDGLMRALQFGDSTLPVGAFSFSNGLEAAVQHGVVRDVETLRQFVRTAVQQAATGDAIALLAAHRAAAAGDAPGVIRADRAVLRRKLNEEMRTMTVRMGKKLGELGDRVAGGPLLGEWLAAIRMGETPGTYPVGLALVAAGLGLEERAAFGLHQYGVASMMLGASLRLMRMSYLDAQAILFEVNAGAERDYERAASATLDDMATFAPLADVLAASHVKAHVRLFMN
jgi:urease accessory protein